MCFLKLYSDNQSFQDVAASTSMPVYSVREKGVTYDDSRPRTKFSLSLSVSERDWDDFKGQAGDAIVFLDRHEAELNALFVGRHDVEAVLDFPVWSRISDDICNQNDQFPKELVMRAGRLGLALELATYARDLEHRLELAEGGN
jgi:hypothetical protein